MVRLPELRPESLQGIEVTLRYVDYRELPLGLQDGMRRYLEHRYSTGGFLEAVLSNDLHRACTAADSTNRHRLYEIVSWLHNQVPNACWGSEEKYTRWVG